MQERPGKPLASVGAIPTRAALSNASATLNTKGVIQLTSRLPIRRRQRRDGINHEG